MAPHSHIKGGLHSRLEAKIPAEFDIYRTFPAKPKKGLGWFFPQGGEMGNGTSQFLSRSRRLLAAKCWLSSSTNICGVKPTTVRVSVYEQWAALLSARPFSSQRGLTRMDDRAMSGRLTEEGDRALTLICRGTNQPRRMGSNPAHIGWYCPW